MYQVNLIKKLRRVNSGHLSRVAIIDTGTNQHPDLKKNLDLDSARVFNCLGSEIDTYKVLNNISDHGAKVASVICATSDKKSLGASKSSQYIPLRIGRYGELGADLGKSMMGAMRYCNDLNIDCINISITVSEKRSFQLISPWIDRLYEKNVPIICAAGNTGGRINNLIAIDDRTISVGCTTPELKISEYSARGENVDFLIPTDEFITISGEAIYKISKGTSYASALMSGIICVIITEFKLKNINYSIDKIRTVLIKSCVNPAGLIGMSSYGVICENKLLYNIKNIRACI